MGGPRRFGPLAFRGRLLGCLAAQEIPPNSRHLRAMLGLVLKEVMHNPVRRDIVIVAPSWQMKVARGHRLEAIKEDRPNGTQSGKMPGHSLTCHRGELPVGVTIHERKQGWLGGTGVLVPKDVGEEPIGLDQGDVVQQRGDAVVAPGRHNIEHGAGYSVELAQRVPAAILHGCKPPPDLRVSGDRLKNQQFAIWHGSISRIPRVLIAGHPA